METTKVKLTLIIEKRANKVIIAEAKKDFVDFLFNLLSLPISTVIRLVTPQILIYIKLWNLGFH